MPASGHKEPSALRNLSLIHILYRQLNLLWGVKPVMIQKERTTDALFEEAVFKAKQAGLVKTGDTVVITAGVPLGVVGKTDMIHVVEVE